MEEDEYADERAEIMEEAAALKKAAVDYMHPEVGVTSCDANGKYLFVLFWCGDEDYFFIQEVHSSNF